MNERFILLGLFFVWLALICQADFVVDPDSIGIASGARASSASYNSIIAGDGEVVIGRFNPDFINVNGQKKLVEMFGNYWHSDKQVRCYEQTEEGRKKYFATYGFKTLIIWEHELKDLNAVEERVRRFNEE